MFCFFSSIICISFLYLEFHYIYDYAFLAYYLFQDQRHNYLMKWFYAKEIGFSYPIMIFYTIFEAKFSIFLVILVILLELFYKCSVYFPVYLIIDKVNRKGAWK